MVLGSTFVCRVSQQWKSILTHITFFYRHEAKTHPGLWLSNTLQTSEKVKVSDCNFFCYVIDEKNEGLTILCDNEFIFLFVTGIVLMVGEIDTNEMVSELDQSVVSFGL